MFSYDLNTTIGKLRLKIRDIDQLKYLFEDAELQYFLTNNGDNLNLAGAEALETAAASAALMAKIETIGAYSKSGISLHTALLTVAKRLRELESDESPAFAIAEQNVSGFSPSELIWNHVLRTGG